MRRYTEVVRQRPLALAALVVGGILVVLAFTAPLLSGVDPNASRVSVRLQGPSWSDGNGGLFGTDGLGRDVFLRGLYGLRTTYLIAFAALLIAVTLGTAIGMVSGYLGGRVDGVLMRLVEIQLALPPLLFVLIVVGTVGRSVGLLVVTLGVLFSRSYIRVVRGSVLVLRTTELVTASKGLGAGTPRILVTHVVPNVLSAVVALMAVDLAGLMLAEASLSFLGYGVQAPLISLGAMLSDGRQFLQSAWWISTFSGVFLLVAVLCTNLVGNALLGGRDSREVGA